MVHNIHDSREWRISGEAYAAAAAVVVVVVDDDGDAGDDDNHSDEIFFGILLKLLKVFFG